MEPVAVRCSDYRFDVHDRCPIEHFKRLYFEFKWWVNIYDAGLVKTDGIGTTG